MGALTGAVAGAATLALLAALPDTPAIVLAAILLGVAAGVYPGVAMARNGPDARDGGETILQWVVAAGFAAAALAGLWFSPWILALAWIAHAGWDVLHHRKLLRARPVTWYPPACLAYDLLLGAYVIVRWAA